MFSTGAASLRRLAEEDDVWQVGAAWLVMLHGGGAMVALLLGALMPLHAQWAWRRRLNARLLTTAFGLCYLGSERVRPWISDSHIAAGLCLPLLVIMHIIMHIALGRRAHSAGER